ncbi:GNAT family N-acetyltransferase [Liquorilactobacillus sicerae]|uniref:GNAT family N-acetyltransferase n=1 Tax=Liquorilactobacillus sicerae TaxID=1416943 RepID=UPI002480B62D|nr:GNAT family protein [Liquorilactobacillus sicerae]
MFSYQVDNQIVLALPRPEIDSPALFALIIASRKKLITWLPWVLKIKSVEDEQNFLKSVCQHFGTGKSLNTVIYYENQPAGMISFNQFRKIDQSADIGYWLGTKFTHKGIMQRSVKAMCQLGFADYQLNKIVINAAIENQSSNRVAQSCGFHFDGVLRANEYLIDGRFHDENHWSLLKAEWEQRR